MTDQLTTPDLSEKAAASGAYSQLDGPAPRFGVSDAIVIAVLLAFNALILVVKGTERFEFFDMSAFLDAGWRVASGQQPYVDFYYTAGPVHLYMHALSFLIFGFTQTAVLVHLCVVGLAATAMAYGIARMHLKPLLACLFGVLTLFSFYGPVCHPWYDQNASIFLLLGVLLWELRARYWSESALPRVAIACGVLSALSFLTKANVGLGGGILFAALFLAGPGRWKNFGTYVAAGAVATFAIVFLALKSPANFIDQNFFAYAPGERLKNFERLVDACLYTPSALVLAIGIGMAVLGGKEFVARNLTRFAMLGGLVAVALFTAWTSSMDIRGNLVWVGFQFITLAILARDFPIARLKMVNWCAVLGLAVFSLMRATQYTSDIVVWAWNPMVLHSDYKLQTPAFRDWKCNGAIGEGLDKTVEYINANIPKNDSVFVFPDSTMIYGLTGRDSYRQAPFIFHRNQILVGKWYDDFRAHFLSEPPKWIVMHYLKQHPQPDLIAGPILKWLKLEEFLDQKYAPAWRHGDFYVLKLKAQ